MSGLSFQKRILYTFLFCICSSVALAQTSEDKNWFSFSYNNNQYGSIIRLPFDNITSIDAASFSFGLERYQSKSFNFSYLLSLGKVTHDSGIGDINLLGVHFVPKFKFNNGKILKETSKLSPFIALGVGFTNFSGTSSAGLRNGFAVGVSPTVGMDWRLSEKVKIFASTAYKINNQNNYREYSVGLGFSIRNQKDTDGDGILDRKDACPDEFGPEDNNGCPYPDRDGDGVIDAEDQCPDLPGKLANGCPDTDGDGIADAEDKCPNEAGENGKDCPEPKDTDGDGVPDEADKCPNEAGAFEGCATDPNAPKIIDTDGDGIPDSEDDCPADKGTADTKGCPVYTPELPVEVITFRFNSTELLPVYKKALDEIALLMKEYDLRLELRGHSDNTGDEAYNLYLSRLRGSAVLEYLVEKGIARTRMTSQGYGIDEPVAENTSRVGRAKNRRVEIKIVEK
ncbi:MAG: OmpA family protein [Roseivirga sp.]|nr:OmpA family protein [Roseivirga sp.]